MFHAIRSKDERQLITARFISNDRTNRTSEFNLNNSTIVEE
jgi:hypothetical protein